MASKKSEKEGKEAEKRFTKYEIARLIGSRALQISMGAPFMVKLEKKELEELRYNPVEIARLEFEKGVLPVKIRKEPERE